MYKYIDIFKKERNIFRNIHIFDNIFIIKYNLHVILKIKTKIMKKLWGVIVSLLGLISLLFVPTVWASFIDDIFGWGATAWGKQVPVCNDGDCSLTDGLKWVEGKVDGMVTGISASSYIQNVVQFLLTFLGVVGVIYIIYAWFQILIWGGDEEKMKSSKTTILYVAIGLAIIFLAAPIFEFILSIFDTATQTTP